MCKYIDDVITFDESEPVVDPSHFKALTNTFFNQTRKIFHWMDQKSTTTNEKKLMSFDVRTAPAHHK